MMLPYIAFRCASNVDTFEHPMFVVSVNGDVERLDYKYGMQTLHGMFGWNRVNNTFKNHKKLLV